MMDIKRFFYASEVIPASEVFSDEIDGFVVHVDNQIFLIRIVRPHPSGWGYFEVYKRKGEKWDLIVPPLVEME
jgi:hypothetical protein